MEEDINKTENSFMKEMHKTSRVYVLISIKGAGKSYFINSFIKYSFLNNIHQNYYLVIPAFKFEQNKSYDYIKSYKSSKNIKIYNKYHEIVGEHVEQDAIKNSNKLRSLFVIDDATGFLNVHSLDTHLKYIITTTRHINCDVIIACHAAANILSSIIKANVDFLLFFKIINAKLLELIYIEYIKTFGIFRNKQEFFKYFNDNINNIKYNCLFIDLVNNNIDFKNYLNYKILSNNNNNGTTSNKQKEKTNIRGNIGKKEELRQEKISRVETEKTSRNNTTTDFKSNSLYRAFSRK
jgi:hypothetical protein